MWLLQATEAQLRTAVESVIFRRRIPPITSRWLSPVERSETRSYTFVVTRFQGICATERSARTIHLFPQQIRLDAVRGISCLCCQFNRHEIAGRSQPTSSGQNKSTCRPRLRTMTRSDSCRTCRRTRSLSLSANLAKFNYANYHLALRKYKCEIAHIRAFQGRSRREIEPDSSSFSRYVRTYILDTMDHESGSRGLVCNGERTRSLAVIALALASRRVLQARPVTIMPTL